jgi:hypothetical protein
MKYILRAMIDEKINDGVFSGDYADRNDYLNNHGIKVYDNKTGFCLLENEF